VRTVCMDASEGETGREDKLSLIFRQALISDFGLSMIEDEVALCPLRNGCRVGQTVSARAQTFHPFCNQLMLPLQHEYMRGFVLITRRPSLHRPTGPQDHRTTARHPRQDHHIIADMTTTSILVLDTSLVQATPA